MAASEPLPIIDKPSQVDLDHCVHCGLCLNACPTYRELGLEMDSPRGRVYQMVKVAAGELEIGNSYVEHINLCLACRACESACPSGVKYGRLVEAARAEIETAVERPLGERLLRRFVFGNLLSSPYLLRLFGFGLYLYQKSGMQALVRSTDLLSSFGKLGEIEQLAPEAEFPSFFSQYGKTFPAEGEKRHRVAVLGGCMANVTFARLNEATIRVLQKNGCEVVVPDDQTCCGALHVHAGETDEARKLARQNIDALLPAGYDAIITNAAGCGSTLKEYDHLLAEDPAYAGRAKQFVDKVSDISEFLSRVELNPQLGPLPVTVTYQDSCHLAHGQGVRTQPRQMLAAVPELTFKEMALSDMCCGSAGIYNVLENEMAMAVLEKKMENVNRTGANVIVTANPGCLLQLRAGAKLHGNGQRVMHVVEVLDESYRAAGDGSS
jgi:glycolate dehydrogenase iron-sulfur subunit